MKNLEFFKKNNFRDKKDKNYTGDFEKSISTIL